MWADRYDGELKNIFTLQDTITRNVVKALSVELTKDDSARVAKRGTGNVQAYDVLLKGWEHYLRQTPDEFRRRSPTSRRRRSSIPATGARGPRWRPSTGKSTHATGGRRSASRATRNTTRSNTWRRRCATRRRSRTRSRARCSLTAQQHAEAIAEAQRAIASDPNDADGYVALAGALSFAGRPAEALEAVERAMRLNPHYPSSYAYQRGLALFGLNRLDEATASLERAVEINRDDYWSQRLLLAVYGLTGRRDDAQRLAEPIKSNDRRGRFAYHDPLTIRGVTYWYPFAKPDDAKRFAAGLAKAGIPE